MEVISIRTEKNFVAPGVYAYEAEIKSWDEKSGNYLYLHYTVFEGNHLSVAHESVLDYEFDDDSEDDIEFIEYYESLADAMVSDYIDGFILMHNLLNEMIDLNYGRRKSIYNYIVSPINFEEVEEEDIDDTTLSATFMYQTKSMKSPVQRRATVTTCHGIVVQCRMYDENDQLLESFEDVEAAERSKWMLLYESLIEQMDDVF